VHQDLRLGWLIFGTRRRKEIEGGHLTFAGTPEGLGQRARRTLTGSIEEESFVWSNNPPRVSNPLRVNYYSQVAQVFGLMPIPFRQSLGFEIVQVQKDLELVQSIWKLNLSSRKAVKAWFLSLISPNTFFISSNHHGILSSAGLERLLDRAERSCSNPYRLPQICVHAG